MPKIRRQPCRQTSLFERMFSSFFNVCGLLVRLVFFSASVIFKAAQKSCSNLKQGINKICCFSVQNIKAVSFGLNICLIFIGCLFSFPTAAARKYISVQGRKLSSLFLFSAAKSNSHNNKVYSTNKGGAL